jgi:hypothetical protein
MAMTKVQTLIDHLIATWPNRSEFDGHVVQVIDGPASADVRNDVLFIGHSIFAPTYAASSSQNWATLGNLTRKEQLSVNCSLRVGQGNSDMAACRARAIRIFEALAGSFRGSIAALTANGEFQQIELSRFLLYQEMSNGVSVTLEFAINATARV